MSKNEKNNQPKKANLMICGSQHFEDPAFVFGILNSFFKQTNGNISTIYTTKFAGSCQYARAWVETTNQFLPEDKKIKIVDYLFDSLLAKKNTALYDEIELPLAAVERSEFFQEVKNKLVEMNVNMVLPFPNQEAELGATTKNIVLAAKIAGIPSLPLDESYRKLYNVENTTESVAEKVSDKQDNKLGFTNKIAPKI
jgi:hypothetical protein